MKTRAEPRRFIYEANGIGLQNGEDPGAACHGVAESVDGAAQRNFGYKVAIHRVENDIEKIEQSNEN